MLRPKQFDYLQDGQGAPKNFSGSSEALSTFCQQTLSQVRGNIHSELDCLQSALERCKGELPSSTGVLFLSDCTRQAAYGSACSFLLALEQCKNRLSVQAVVLNRCSEAIADRIRASAEDERELGTMARDLHQLRERMMLFCDVTARDFCERAEAAADMVHDGERLNLHALQAFYDGAKRILEDIVMCS